MCSAGSTLAQLLVILALGASLHAVGQHASIATLITVNTVASHRRRRRSRAWRPRRREGRPDRRAHQRRHTQDQAVAAVLIQRSCTSYLPPVWGWITLAWMRRREYI